MGVVIASIIVIMKAQIQSNDLPGSKSGISISKGRARQTDFHIPASRDLFYGVLQFRRVGFVKVLNAAIRRKQVLMIVFEPMSLLVVQPV